MSDLIDGCRLPPDLWKNGRFPSMDDYRKILQRGRLLYSLDVGSYTGPVGPDVADRPCNMLYASCGKGFTRNVGVTLGTGPNDELLPYVDEYRDYICGMHDRGVVVVVYQNDCNFAEPFFEPEQVRQMDAELDPFSWAFGTPGRRFACLNKPGWRSYIFERLKIRVGMYGADGVFLDNNTPFIHCRCEHCQRLYTEWCGGSLLEDMGSQETIVADMRVFDYIGAMQVPRKLPRLEDPKRLRYYEWRVLRSADFYRTVRRRLEEDLGRPVIFTANGHLAIAEQAGVQLSNVFDMHFSEDGFTAPPVSNKFTIRLGVAMGQGIRPQYTLTRTMESLPVPDMVKVLAAEGRANGGSGEFWDMIVRQDERLLQAVKTMRNFFVKHSGDIFAVERDINDIALLFSWRSDLWTSQSISPAKRAADLVESMMQSYDVLIAEREEDADLLSNYKLLIVPNTEIVSESWFKAFQRFLDNGGKVITTGNVAAFNEQLLHRSEQWQGDGWVHFEHEQELSVKAVSKALGELAVEFGETVPMTSINHTRLPDGEAVHIVNRRVNIFPVIHITPREGLTVRLHPGRNVSKAVWLTPDGPDVELPVRSEGRGLEIALPTLWIYGILRLYYKED